MATYENEDLLANQEVAARSGFNLTPYGTGGNENARTFPVSGDCTNPANCLTLGVAETFTFSENTGTIVTGSNSKIVSATVSLIIGADNKAFYKIDYQSQRTGGSSNPDVFLYGYLNGFFFGDSTVAKGKWNTTNPVTGTYSTEKFDYTSVKCGDTFSYNLKEVSNGANGTLNETLTQLAYCSEDCEESFSYVDNGDNAAYVFTYIPSEDMSAAALVFTFAQGVAASATGLDGWATNGSTRQITMDLVACQEYTWTVDLTPDCSGSSANSNVWTDFKVNTVSKKGTLSNITESCN